MRSVSRFVLATVVATVAAAFGPAGIAQAATIYVHPGESIQAAVDAANPGDTIIVLPGEYNQQVVVWKDGISLLGSGADSNGTVLLPPAQSSSLCDQFGGSTAIPKGPGGVPAIGICVVGDPSTGNAVENDRVSGFLVANFAGIGIVAFVTEDVKLDHNVAADNGGYGITAFESDGVTIADNEAYGSGEAAFYTGDSPSAHLLAMRNYAHDSAQGYFIRNASHGKVINNTLTHNCAGVVILANEPGPARHWYLSGNRINNNDRFCRSEEGPALAGLGVGVVGAQYTTLESNTVKHNGAFDSGTRGSAVSGGIYIIQNGSFVPHDDLFEQNVVLFNDPLDFFWDQTGYRVHFQDNRCSTSVPSKICQ